VHRDVKPANLFLARRPDGQYSVKILDFGIAKQRVNAESPALTDPGKSLGSPWYMSPEQMLTPASVDERADVWSLGVLLFELLTTRRPFDGESVPQVCANVLTTTPAQPSDFRADLAPELDEIVLYCLEKEPQRRLRSVSELAQALLPFTSAPLPGVTMAFDDSRQSNPEPVAYELRRAPSFGSLTPLHTGLRGSGAYPPLRRRSWSLALPLVALALLLFGGWLQYRDPTLVPRAARAVRATHLALPWDPRLASDEPAATLSPVPEPPTVLQSLRTGRALPEIAHPDFSPDGTVALTPEQIRQRVENYEAWLRAQGLKRLNDAEP
jgi:hypothetical protein